MLGMVHEGIVRWTGNDFWRLSDTEQREISQATANVMRHFDMRSTQKTMDIAAFGIAIGSAYLPRIVLQLDTGSAGSTNGTIASPAGSRQPNHPAESAGGIVFGNPIEGTATQH